MGDQYEDARRRFGKDAEEVSSDTNMIGLLSRMTGLVPWAVMKRPAKVACTAVSSKSVHNADYAHILGEKVKELSRGYTSPAHKDLAKALAETLDLAGAADPDTVVRIPRGIEVCSLLDIAAQIGDDFSSSLNEPLLNFVKTGYKKPGVGKYDDSDAHREATKQAFSDCNMLFCQNQIAAFIPKDMMKYAANVVSTFLVSNYFYDPVYGHALGEEIKVLSRGNQAERDLALALYQMRHLAETVNPDTIQRIPREIEGGNLSTIAARVGNGCRILNEPLLNFVLTAYNQPGVGELQNNNANPALPVNSSLLSPELNLGFAALGVAIAGGVMASGAAKDSPYVGCFAAVNLVGISSHLLAALTRKNRWSRCLTNTGGIGVSSAVAIALGNVIDTATIGNVNVSAPVIALICLISSFIILRYSRV